MDEQNTHDPCRQGSWVEGAGEVGRKLVNWKLYKNRAHCSARKEIKVQDGGGGLQIGQRRRSWDLMNERGLIHREQVI